MKSCKWFASIPSFLKSLAISYTFENPPIISFFNVNSGDILKYTSISNALWCVINGFAVAPEAVFCKTGVSTSKNSCVSKNSLINLINFVLNTNLFLASSFIIKSRCLSLYTASWSVNPWNFSGSGRIAFPKNVYS